MPDRTIMTFATLDEAESTLDWIGLEFAEGDGWFGGELIADDEELLEEALDDPEAPDEVHRLAKRMRDHLAAHPDGASWRVTFPG